MCSLHMDVLKALFFCSLWEDTGCKSNPFPIRGKSTAEWSGSQVQLLQVCTQESCYWGSAGHRGTPAWIKCHSDAIWQWWAGMSRANFGELGVRGTDEFIYRSLMKYLSMRANAASQKAWQGIFLNQWHRQNLSAECLFVPSCFRAYSCFIFGVSITSELPSEIRITLG